MNNMKQNSAGMKDDAVKNNQLTDRISDILIDQLKCSIIVLSEQWIVDSEFLHVLVQSADDAVERMIEQQMLQLQ